jgi:hypothetical protein
LLYYSEKGLIIFNDRVKIQIFFSKRKSNDMFHYINQQSI